ncbi:hypothetical protein BN2127_JRS3_00493 [Bacillus safensis]|uniref:hypothetical protein n=1 Tax=Bacillus safensis TaxID=561879 RepID=UPI0006A8E568|nr:hypothetical protein [Bacillus safensis]CUB15746.1 hypothetical protein BN2127_JRS3_00493 [Bacillus safensis]
MELLKLHKLPFIKTAALLKRESYLFLNILLPQLKKLKCIVEGNQKNNERNDLFYNIKPKHLLYEMEKQQAALKVINNLLNS